jgi:polar amino acid transport system substrate-binding protein
MGATGMTNHDDRVGMKRFLLVTGLVMALGLAGCGSAAPTASGSAVAATVPRPLGVQDPATPPTAAAGSGASCGDPTASYPAMSPIPTPGQMPSGSTMATILKRGTLIAGIDQNTYLFGYRDPDSGQPVGFDIDMVHAIAKAIFGDPSKVTFVAITSAERIPYLQNKTVDIVADTMTINCDRWKQVAFSTVYYNAGQTVLVPKSSTANGIADLGGKKVCAAAGSTSIANIASAPSHPIPVSVADWTDCLVLLQQHQIDAISTDDTILRGLAAQDPQTRLVSAPPFTSEPYGLAMNANQTDLVGFVNGVLDRMRHDGQWAAIYGHWLGGDVPAPPTPKYGR